MLSSKEATSVSDGTEADRASTMATRKSGMPGLLLANVGILLGFHSKNTTRYGSSGGGAGVDGTGDGLCLGRMAICL